MRRLIIAAIVIISIIVATGFIYIFSMCSSTWNGSDADNNSKETDDYQALSDSQKAEAISIARNNSVVSFQAGYALGWVKQNTTNYHIKDVVTSSFEDLSPFAEKSKVVMPAVIIVAGNESEVGVNLFVFTDLSKKRIAYTGYVIRDGESFGPYNYSYYGNGVQIMNTTGNYYGYLSNVTNVDSGIDDYSDPAALEAQAISHAQNNATVKSYLEGRKYKTGMSMAGEEYGYGGYRVSYPVVQFYVYKDQTTETDYVVWVAVNVKNGHVNIAKAGYTDRPHPPPPLGYPA